MLTTAHVICMNDSVEFVVAGTEKVAEELKQKLSDEYFARNTWHYSSEKEYKLVVFWRNYDRSRTARTRREGGGAQLEQLDGACGWGRINSD